MVTVPIYERRQGLDTAPQTMPRIRVTSARGDALQGVGRALQGVANQLISKAIEREDFQDHQKWLQHQQNIAQIYTRYQDQASQTGENFHDGYLPLVDQENRRFLENDINPRNKDKYAAMGETLREQQSTTAGVEQLSREKQTQYNTMLQSFENIAGQVEADPDSFGDIIDGYAQNIAALNLSYDDRIKLFNYMEKQVIAAYNSILMNRVTTGDDPDAILHGMQKIFEYQQTKQHEVRKRIQINPTVQLAPEDPSAPVSPGGVSEEVGAGAGLVELLGFRADDLQQRASFTPQRAPFVEAYARNPGSMTRETFASRYYRAHEVLPRQLSRRGRPNPTAYISTHALQTLDRTMDIFGRKVPINLSHDFDPGPTSGRRRGVRFTWDNPGARGSEHLSHGPDNPGEAFDLQIQRPEFSDADRAAILEAAIVAGFTGFGFYDGAHLHVDTGAVRSWHKGHKSPKDIGWSSYISNLPRWARPVMKKYFGDTGQLRRPPEVMIVNRGRRRFMPATNPAQLDLYMSAVRNTSVSARYLSFLHRVESTRGTNLQSRGQSAYGHFQFQPATWDEQMKRMGVFDAQGNVNRDQLTALGLAPDTLERLSKVSGQEVKKFLRNDMQFNAMATAHFTEHNKNVIRQAYQREPSESEIYFSHLLGTTGGKQFFERLHTTPNETAAQHFKDAASANVRLFFHDPKTKQNPKTFAEMELSIREEIEAEDGTIAASPGDMVVMESPTFSSEWVGSGAGLETTVGQTMSMYRFQKQIEAQRLEEAQELAQREAYDLMLKDTQRDPNLRDGYHMTEEWLLENGNRLDPAVFRTVLTFLQRRNEHNNENLPDYPERAEALQRLNKALHSDKLTILQQARQSIEEEYSAVPPRLEFDEMIQFQKEFDAAIAAVQKGDREEWIKDADALFEGAFDVSPSVEPPKRSRAQSALAQARIAMREWRRTHPDATYTEAMTMAVTIKDAVYDHWIETQVTTLKYPSGWDPDIQIHTASRTELEREVERYVETYVVPNPDPEERAALRRELANLVSLAHIMNPKR